MRIIPIVYLSLPSGGAMLNIKKSNLRWNTIGELLANRIKTL